MQKLIIASAIALLLSAGTAVADREDTGDMNFGRQDFIEKRWPTPKGKRVQTRFKASACDSGNWRKCVFENNDSDGSFTGRSAPSDDVGRE